MHFPCRNYAFVWPELTFVADIAEPHEAAPATKRPRHSIVWNVTLAYLVEAGEIVQVAQLGTALFVYFCLPVFLFLCNP